VKEIQMPTTDVSVFDLSPAEKLQLVEDLWDDLASAPDAVPVQEWQQSELIRRKHNLLSRPATGLTWAELKQRVRQGHGR
jgi:putative addiction module component (TIGR02574 family)